MGSSALLLCLVLLFFVFAFNGAHSGSHFNHTVHCSPNQSIASIFLDESAVEIVRVRGQRGTSVHDLLGLLIYICEILRFVSEVDVLVAGVVVDGDRIQVREDGRLRASERVQKREQMGVRALKIYIHLFPILLLLFVLHHLFAHLITLLLYLLSYIDIVILCCT